MKPETLVNLIGQNMRSFLKGYESGAQNEGYAQVEIDEILKTHAGIHIFNSPKIREVAYPNQAGNPHPQTADFVCYYSRYKDPKLPHPYSGRPIHFGGEFVTAYNIEVKSQSKATNKFSGMTWYTAFESDIQKLSPLAQWTRCLRNINSDRSFVVLLAFNPLTIADITANYGAMFPGSIFARWQGFGLEMGVLVQQI